MKRNGDVSVAAAGAAVADALGAEVSPARPVTARIAAYDVKEPMALDEAEAAAAEVAKRAGVEWAEPNLIMQAHVPYPTPINDQYAGFLPNVWDIRDASAAAVSSRGVTPWPAGGYGVKSPAVWPYTTGAGVRVAVLDTGIRPDHPEFQGQLVPGYDMISEPLRANDPDGRDADPSDMGDWTTAGQCGVGRPATDSSWHGTHVAGTIAAAANNSVGVAGIAPGAKIQAVRVLGKCGGTSADIAAGIVWAAGGEVPGLPLNAAPSQVLNMSLGGTFPSCPSVYGDAINAARGRGASIVVSAGNNNSPASGATPANCPGVVTVASLSPYGDKASYSNFGPEVEISAIGGEQNEGTPADGVLSTLDSGTTTPVGPTYEFYQGTSMSAPAVAGGAAIIASLGPIGPDAMTAALQASTIPFPTSSNNNATFQACDTARCGAGVLDLTRLPVPTGGPVITGGAYVGGTLNATPGTWAGSSTTPSVTWLIDGVAVAEGPTYKPGKQDVKKSIVAFAHAAGAFAAIGKASAPLPIGKAVSKVKVKGKKKVRPGNRAKIKIKVKVAGIKGKQIKGKIKVVLKKKGSKKVKGKFKLKKKHKGKIKILTPRLRRGKYKLTVKYTGNAYIAKDKAKKKIKVGR